MQERCYDDTRLPLERRREYLSWRRLTLRHTSVTPTDWSLELETNVCEDFTITEEAFSWLKALTSTLTINDQESIMTLFKMGALVSRRSEMPIQSS